MNSCFLDICAIQMEKMNKRTKSLYLLQHILYKKVTLQNTSFFQKRGGKFLFSFPFFFSRQYISLLYFPFSFSHLSKSSLIIFSYLHKIDIVIKWISMQSIYYILQRGSFWGGRVYAWAHQAMAKEEKASLRGKINDSKAWKWLI